MFKVLSVTYGRMGGNPDQVFRKLTRLSNIVTGIHSFCVKSGNSSLTPLDNVFATGAAETSLICRQRHTAVPMDSY